MTREQFDKLSLGDKVKHPFGGIGVVTEKDNGTYTVKDKGFDQGDGMCEVSFAWNEGEICIPTGMKESPLKTFPRVNDFELGSSYRR